MKAEINFWSATFFATEAFDPALYKLCLVAREHGYRFGSVNCFTMLWPRLPDPVAPYIWFPDFDEEDVRRLLLLVGADGTGVPVRVIPFEPPRWGREVLPVTSDLELISPTLSIPVGERT